MSLTVTDKGQLQTYVIELSVPFYFYNFAEHLFVILKNIASDNNLYFFLNLSTEDEIKAIKKISMQFCRISHQCVFFINIKNFGHTRNASVSKIQYYFSRKFIKRLCDSLFGTVNL